jgi:hypothetical protein
VHRDSEQKAPGTAIGIGRRHFLMVALAGVTATACGARNGFGPVSAAEPVTSAQVKPPPSSVVPVVRSSVIPDNLLIGFCGAPGSTAMGRMTGDLARAGDALSNQIEKFPSTRPTMPVVELIATTVHRSPGRDGMYRSRAEDTTIQRYLDQARAAKGLLLLNIQPGRADFLPEVRAYERWLREPDVGVALDPEWAVEEGVVPGRKFGRTTGTELDGVAEYLGRLATDNGLPDKVMVYHQVAASVVRDEADLKPHVGVSAVKVVDGIGSAAAKQATWKQVMKQKPDHVQAGFKVFFDEDTRRGNALMTPAEVMALTPTPAYVLYE